MDADLIASEAQSKMDESTSETKKYEIEVDDFQHRFIIQALSEKRNELIAEGKSTEDINDLLLKAIDAKPVKNKKRSTY